MSTPRNSNDPYRIIIWGPGAMGQACIREIVKRPEFKLVGVLAYNDSKAGKDIGELMGIGPLGVKIINDKQAIYAMDADVVIWAGRPAFDPESMDQEVLRLLESGKNVVTPAAYHYPAQHGNAYVQKFLAACRKGNSSLHGTGENPGYWFERMVPTLTGLCTSVEKISLVEYADCGLSSRETLFGVGFGMTAEEAKEKTQYLQRMWQEYYFVESLDLVCQTTWGRSMDRFEVTQKYHPAERDIILDKATGDPTTISIKKGLTSGITNKFTGYVDDEPRVSIQVNWFLRPRNSPFPVKGGDTWTIEIEAKPVSMRCQFDLFASLKGELEFHPGEQVTMAWYATVVPMLQAIPIVVGAPPGIVVPSVFANCVPDFRSLENRKSIVDVHRYRT
jgi:2,4-diaminopentanoate dehydrogenase